MRIIVAFGAGGGSDQLARQMARAIKATSGLDVTIVNRPADGGMEAIRIFMRQPSNGYNILLMTEGAAANYASGQLAYNLK
ncbi:hypothetical protein [Aestuariispira insulae]|uniref:hypothetical protein n=1 Tax=Aestuariispira insulae TaxID=1461337 RepID=UPI0011C0467A|nr:hypothetical protein [Aestuariispira insulae]